MVWQGTSRRTTSAPSPAPAAARAMAAAKPARSPAVSMPAMAPKRIWRRSSAQCCTVRPLARKPIDSQRVMLSSSGWP